MSGHESVSRCLRNDSRMTSVGKGWLVKFRGKIAETSELSNEKTLVGLAI